MEAVKRGLFSTECGIGIKRGGDSGSNHIAAERGAEVEQQQCRGKVEHRQKAMIVDRREHAGSALRGGMSRLMA